MLNEWLKHLARLNLPVYQFESEGMRMIYAGYSSVKKKYYIRMFLDTLNRDSYRGRRWFWEIPGLIKSGKIDIVVSETSHVTLKYFQKCNGFIVPEWTAMRINIEKPINEICHRNVSDFSNVMRRIRKHNLTYEILSDNKNFKFFKEKIYIPYLTSRYGEEALIDDLDILWNSQPSPVLMAVKEDGLTVGASLIRKDGDSLHLIRVGLLDGDDKYRLHGVIGALYYFGIIEGQKMGCSYFDLGGTRPFLMDGLTKFKMGLGAEFVTELSSKKDYLWLGINAKSSVAQAHINNNPFMHADKDFRLIKSEP